MADTTVSVFSAKGPPVPIPNTEVKLCCADNTCLETSREDRSMLTHAPSKWMVLFFFLDISVVFVL